MRRRGIVARRAAALLTLAALCASGCSSGSGAQAASSLPPAPLPRPEAPTSIPTPSTSTPSVELPGSATDHSVAGGEAFARDYFRAVGKAFQARSTSGLVQFVAETCASCTKQIEAINAMVRESQHYRGDTITVLSSQSPSDRLAEPLLVYVTLRQGDGAIVDRNGATTKSYHATKTATVLQVALVWRQGRWQVAAYDLGDKVLKP